MTLYLTSKGVDRSVHLHQDMVLLTESGLYCFLAQKGAKTCPIGRRERCYNGAAYWTSTLCDFPGPGCGSTTARKLTDYHVVEIVILAETPNAIVHYNWLRERGFIEINPDRSRHFRLGQNYTHQRLLELLSSEALRKNLLIFLNLFCSLRRPQNVVTLTTPSQSLEVFL